MIQIRYHFQLEYFALLFAKCVYIWVEFRIAIKKINFLSQTPKTRLDCGNKAEFSGRFPNSLADSSNLCPLVIRDGGRFENVEKGIGIVVGITDNWYRFDWSAKIREGVRGPPCPQFRRPWYCSALCDYFCTYIKSNKATKTIQTKKKNKTTNQCYGSRAWLSRSKNFPYPLKLV